VMLDEQWDAFAAIPIKDAVKSSRVSPLR